jgi:hypothetical protein
VTELVPALSGDYGGHPVHDGNCEPVFPAVEGADLLLRLDLFARLRDVLGETRIGAGVWVDSHAGEDARHHGVGADTSPCWAAPRQGVATCSPVSRIWFDLALAGCAPKTPLARRFVPCPSSCLAG